MAICPATAGKLKPSGCGATGQAGLQTALLAIVAVASVLLTGCAKRETPVEAGNRTHTLLVGNGVEPSTLDPQLNSGAPEASIIRELFEGLVGYDAKLNIVPAAAESWDYKEGGRILTFHLRPGLKWSNGDPLTAQDFRDSFKRLIEPALGSEYGFLTYPVVGAMDYNRGRTHDFSKVGVRAVDEVTLRFELEKPTPIFLNYLANVQFMPVNLKSIERSGGIYDPTNPWISRGEFVSNGPMMLSEWKRNQFVTLVRNPNYRDKDAIKLNEIRFLPIDSIDAEEKAFRSGQVHITSAVLLSRVDYYRRENPKALHVEQDDSIEFVMFNTKHPPFDDVRVRRAFSLAIDRQALTSAIYSGTREPAFTLHMDGVGGFHPEHRITGGAVEARALLAEAGYPRGAGFPPVTFLFNTSEQNLSVAQVLQEMWRSVLGVQVTIANQEWKVYLDSLHQGNFQMARAALGAGNDASGNFLPVLTGSDLNFTGWSNPEFDALYETAIHTQDRAARFADYQRMDEIQLREMPIAPVAHHSQLRLVDPSVYGWSDNSLDIHHFARFTLEGEMAR